jgi:hypothetical protein
MVVGTVVILPTPDMRRYSLLVFLAALPLINVVFDWISLGVTRGLLSWQVSGRPSWLATLGIGALDLFVAVILLFALAE